MDRLRSLGPKMLAVAFVSLAGYCSPALSFAPAKPIALPLRTFNKNGKDFSLMMVSTMAPEQQQQRQRESLSSASSINILERPSTSLRDDISESSDSNEESTSWQDDGFVFGLNGSGLERPSGRTASIVVEGDTLESTAFHKGLVGFTFAGHAGFAVQSIIAMSIATASSGTTSDITGFVHGMMMTVGLGGTVATALTVLGKVCFLTWASWILADFGSGVLHWSVDNCTYQTISYGGINGRPVARPNHSSFSSISNIHNRLLSTLLDGNGRTPIMGGIIAAFQGHHSAPWTITYREFCNNVSKLCLPFGVWTIAAMQFIFHLGPEARYFWTTFLVFEILSQEFHKWSHQLPSESPAWVNELQKLGLTIDRKPHSLHHKAPYEGNYCIISGVCNPYLDQSGFFRRLEHLVYRLNGVESNAWKLDPELRERTLQGDYEIPLMKNGRTKK